MKLKNNVWMMLLAALCGCNFNNTNNKVNPAQLAVPTKAEVFVTAKDTTLRLTKTSDVTFEDFGQPVETQVCVFVDPSKTFQTMEGIGGALTDASAEVFAKLSEAKQKELLNAYYSPSEGIGYTFAPISQVAISRAIPTIILLKMTRC